MPRRTKNEGNYIRIGTYSVGEILDVVGTGKRTFKAIVDGTIKSVEVKTNSSRYRMFKQKGIKCVKCGLRGKFFALERSKGATSDKSSYHFNLYGILPNGKERMMTKDHIIPKAAGGEDKLENYQPMCRTCNGNKADKIECLERE